jgi:hypothetical protein
MTPRFHPEDALDTLKFNLERPFLSAVPPGTRILSAHKTAEDRQKVVDTFIAELDAHVSALPVDFE